MEPVSHPVSHPPIDLDEHGAFLRRLATRLLHDEHGAEDVVQEAWEAARGRPAPEGVPRRAWLAGIVRNLSLRRMRTEGRRRAREEIVARKATTARRVPTPDEMAARVEVQRLIADEVSRLEEPGRTAIVLRYYDGLTPTQIAAEQDVPVRTVETRLRRAREKLRRRLDAVVPGGRAAWTGALAPWLLPNAPPTVPSVPEATSPATAATGTAGGVGPWIAVGSALLAVAGTLGFTARGWVAPPSEREPETRVEAPSVAPPTAPTSIADDIGTERRRRLAAESEADALRLQLEALRAEAGAATSPPAPPSRPLPPYLEDVAYADAVQQTDFSASAEAVLGINRMLPRIIEAVEAGTSRAGLVGEVQRWNGVLVRDALRLERGGVPGVQTNGTFSNPAYMAQLIAATLELAGQPLDPVALSSLGRIAETHLDADRRMREGFRDDQTLLEKVLIEARARGRFFADVAELLSPEQLEVLRPQAGRDRLQTDMFSEGILLTPHIRPFRARRDQLAERMAGHLIEELDGAHAEQVGRLTELWVEGLSGEELAPIDDRLSSAGVLPIDWAFRMTERYVELQHAVLSDLSPEDPSAERLRTSAFAFVALIRE